VELSIELVGVRLAQPGAGLLVDLDGTLVNSEAANQSAFRQYFAARGWRVPDDVVRGFAGRRAHEVFAAVEGPWVGEDPHALTRGVMDVLRGMDVRPSGVPGAVRLLAACVTTGLPVAVVTSAGRAWAMAALRSLHVTDGAIGMITAEDCRLGKPDPEPFRRGAEMLGLDPRLLVALEDAPAGIASARAAGVGHVVGVTTGHPAHVLVSAGAAETAADLIALADLIEGRPPGSSPAGWSASIRPPSRVPPPAKTHRPTGRSETEHE